ncbi:hypothetical protein FM113_09190 [Leucobacter sp. 7(1)]|nr:hypothetical protein FM113_09190 [Leucobacter sp. 7(1)]
MVGIGASYGIGAIAEYGLLIPLAAPFGLLCIAALIWLAPKAQLIAWAALTAWLLAPTYLGQGDQEIAALVVIVLLCLLGVFVSPWFLVAAWVLHPLWDVLAFRDLHGHMEDLPCACCIYDLIIGAYLAFRTWRGHFTAVGTPQPVSWRQGLRRTGIAVWVGVLLLVQVVLVWFGSGQGWLTLAAAAAGLAVVAGLFWLRPQAQSLAWVAITAWMGMTYAHSGAWFEILVFMGIMLVGMLGYLTSPWWFVVAWGFHLLWNFLPRETDHHAAHATMGHLGISPAASATYDVIIFAYLLVAVLAGRLGHTQQELMHSASVAARLVNAELQSDVVGGRRRAVRVSST